MADDNYRATSEFITQMQAAMQNAQIWSVANQPQAVQAASNVMQGGYATVTPSDVSHSIVADLQTRQLQQDIQQQTLAAQRNQMDMMQQQMMMASQAAQANQYALGAYHRMDPFATAPGFNPALTDTQAMQANMQLAATNYMNPYIASTMSRSGHMRGMMPDAEFSTSPRYGVYRDSMYGRGPDAAPPTPGFLSDWLTMTGLRSMPLYENPYEATSNAYGRWSRRKEAIAGTAGNIGAFGLSMGMGMAMAGLPGIAASFAVEPLINSVIDPYFDRRAQANRVADITRNFVTTGADMGPTGRGLSYRSSAEITRDMRKYAADSPFFNQEDMEQILRSSSEAGTMNFVNRKEDIVRAMKQQSEMLRTFMRITGDPDLKAAFEKMANFQAMGVSTNNQTMLLNNIQAFSRMAGVGTQQMLSTGAAIGGQQAVNMGAVGQLGMYTGAMAQAGVKWMMQTGALNPLELHLRGGESGMSQNMSLQMLSRVHTDLARFLPAMISPTGEGGRFELNQDMIRKYQSGTSFDDLANIATQNLSKYGNAKGFVHERERLLGELESQLRPEDIIGATRAQVSRYRDKTGGSSEDAYYRFFGNDWKYAQHMHSAEGLTEIQNQLKTQLQQDIFSNFSAARTATRPWNRAGTWLATKGNELVEDMYGSFMLNKASEQQMVEGQGVSLFGVGPRGQLGNWNSFARDFLGGSRTTSRALEAYNAVIPGGGATLAEVKSGSAYQTQAQVTASVLRMNPILSEFAEQFEEQGATDAINYKRAKTGFLFPRVTDSDVKDFSIKRAFQETKSLQGVLTNLKDKDLYVGKSTKVLAAVRDELEASMDKDWVGVRIPTQDERRSAARRALGGGKALSNEYLDEVAAGGISLMQHTNKKFYDFFVGKANLLGQSGGDVGDAVYNTFSTSEQFSSAIEGKLRDIQSLSFGGSQNWPKRVWLGMSNPNTSSASGKIARLARASGIPYVSDFFEQAAREHASTGATDLMEHTADLYEKIADKMYPGVKITEGSKESKTLDEEMRNIQRYGTSNIHDFDAEAGALYKEGQRFGLTGSDVVDANLDEVTHLSDAQRAFKKTTLATHGNGVNDKKSFQEAMSGMLIKESSTSSELGSRINNLYDQIDKYRSEDKAHGDIGMNSGKIARASQEMSAISQQKMPHDVAVIAGFVQAWGLKEGLVSSPTVGTGGKSLGAANA